MKFAPCTAMSAALILGLSACDRQEAAGDAPAAATAASLEALNGTWKADLASIKFEGRPNEVVLQDGTFECKTCIPPLTVPADGQFHPVADQPYFDSISVKAVDDRTVEVRRRKGEREVSSSTMQVSADGNARTSKFTNANNPSVPPIKGTETARRAGPAPAGAHAISGQWTPERVQDYSEDALNITFRVVGNQVTTSVQGETYTAEIGGPAVPVQGDAGGTTIAVTREGNGLRETATRGGKEVNQTVILPSADGSSVTFTSTDPRDGEKTTWTAKKSG